MLLLGRAVNVALQRISSMILWLQASAFFFFFPVLKCNTWILGKGKNLLFLPHKTRECILSHHSCCNHSCTAEPDALAGLCSFPHFCSSSGVSRHESKSGDCRVSLSLGVHRETLGKRAAAMCRALEVRAGVTPGEYWTEGYYKVVWGNISLEVH